MKEPRSLSVVLPAYNEAQSISTTILDALAYLKTKAMAFEIIVVDDGSRDQTPDIVETLSLHAKEVKLLRHKKNRGYGEALRSGFNAASYEWILLMDSDGQFKIKSIEKFLPFCEQHDMILGVRKNRADNTLRKVSTWVYVKFVNALLNLKLQDFGCGFKLFRRDAWLNLQPIKSTDDKMFSVEWLYQSVHKNIPLVEVEVDHYPRLAGNPTGAHPAIAIKGLFRLLNIVVSERYPKAH